MPRPKNPNNQYFNSDVEEAIHTYNVSTDDTERTKLFRIIYPALAKLAEVWRNKIKPVYVPLTPEELELDCIAFLLEKMYMVKRGKGKAFSYLTVTARNYYIQQNMVAYSKRKKHSLISLSDNFDIEDVPTDRVQQMEDSAELFDKFMEYIDENFDEIFPTKKHRLFGNIFMEKVKTDGLLETFNRRNFLNDISQETGIERGMVTKHVNRVASHFTTFKEYYEMYGSKPEYKERVTVTERDEAYIRKNYVHYSKRNGVNGISRRLGINYNVVLEWIKTNIT